MECQSILEKNQNKTKNKHIFGVKKAWLVYTIPILHPTLCSANHRVLPDAPESSVTLNIFPEMIQSPLIN